MQNALNTGNLQTLTAGNSLLVNARKVAGGKLQLELAEVLNTSSANNPLAIFNKSDDRFSQGGARRAWLTAESDDASKLLGIDLSDNQNWIVDELGRTVLPLNVLNPKVQVGDNTHTLRIEVVETTTPTEWQALNIETAAKRAGRDGAYITHQGKYIFSNTRVCFDKANHILLQSDARQATVDVNTGEIFN
jgi:hypothetical protein